MSDQILSFLIELITGYILQGFSFVLFIYAFNKTKMKKGKYLLCSVVMTLFIYLSRNFGINFGVHIILNLILLIVLMVGVEKFSIRTSTVGGIIATFLMIIIEVLDVLVLKLVLKNNFEIAMQDPLTKPLYAAPATILLFLVAFILYKNMTKARKVEPNEAD